MKHPQLTLLIIFLLFLAACTTSEKQKQSIEFKQQGTISKSIDDIFFTNIAEGGNGIGEISYTGSDSTIATVDPITGEVSFIKEGKLTVTATKAEDSEYLSATARYTILITDQLSQQSPKQNLPPLLLSYGPANDNADVPLGSTIEFSLHNALDKKTVDNTTFTISDINGKIEGDIVFNENSAQFTPNNSLSGFTKYTVNLKSSISDIAGNSLNINFNWTFRTAADESKWYSLNTKAMKQQMFSINPQSGKCSMGNSEDSSERNQQWRFNAVYNSEGYYFIQNAGARNNKALSSEKLENTCSLVNIDNMNSPDPALLWKISPTENGYFKLYNRRWGAQKSLESIDGQPPVLTDTGFSLEQQWKLSEVENLSSNQLTKSIKNAIWVINTLKYQFVENARIQIKNAPNDLDWKRWATLDDGVQSQLFFFKRNTNNTLYSFRINNAKTIYHFDENIGEIKLNNIPSDANTNSFSMIHDGSSSKLFMQSKIKDALYQFNFDSQNKSYELNTDRPTMIYNAPADSDWYRWAMLHDGNNTLLYVFKKETPDEFYQFGLNPGSQSFEYGFPSASFLYLVDIPTDSNTNQFSMLHTGNAYEFYFLTQ